MVSKHFLLKHWQAWIGVETGVHGLLMASMTPVAPLS